MKPLGRIKEILMSKLRYPIFILGFILILAGCEGSVEDPVIPRGVTDPEELTQRAFQKQEIGAFEEAIEILNKAVEIDPKFVPAHFRMGSVYEEWDQRKEAIAAYQHALKLWIPTTWTPGWGWLLFMANHLRMNWPLWNTKKRRH